MADVFISYSSKDREKVKILVSLIEEAGWTVWWDRETPAGELYHRRIDDELKSARCVVVAWSNQSLSSDWVLEEAQTAKNKGKPLIPVLLEEVEPPLGFRNIQAASLTTWKGESKSEELHRLLERISQILGGGARPVGESQIEAAVGNITRVEVAEACFEYFAARAAFDLSRTEATVERIRLAYEGLANVLAPLSDDYLHKLIERGLP